MLEHRADLGLALDGDADRLLAVDANGRLTDGDELLALFALDLAERGRLSGNSVVVTVMTNLGFRLAMERARDRCDRDTGGRPPRSRCPRRRRAMPSEASSRVTSSSADLATTGDGLLTGLVLADLVARSGKPLAELVEGLVTPVPQVLVNVPVPDTELLAGADAVWSAVAEEQERLGDAGRVVLRPSGTEPVVRVMVEATGDGVAEEIAERLGSLVGFELTTAASAEAAAPH